MKRFAALFKELDATTGTNAKVAALRRYFETEPPENAVWALYLLTGKLRRKTLTSRALREIFTTITDLPEWLIKDAGAHVGDTAETVALLVNATPLSPTPSLELPLHEWLESEIPKAADADAEAKRELVLRWWSGLPEEQIFILHKILAGSFRVGVSATLVTRALAEAVERDKAELTHRLMGDFPTTPEFYRSLAEGLSVTVPCRASLIPFLLAYPVELDAVVNEGLRNYRLEWKWDGVRSQVVKRSGEVFLWSRGEDLVTAQFPQLAEAFLALPDGTVLDGEIVAWGEGEPLPFNELQKRLGRKKVTKKVLGEVPVHYLAYDLLEQDGTDLRDLPLAERRSWLEAFVAEHPLEALTLTDSLKALNLDELEALRTGARAVGAEGLMLKKLDSPYLVGRRKGLWWKHKVDPYTLDAVLIYAQAGTGRRANLFTDYTFALWQGDELVPFAKAYSGLTDKEIGSLDHWVRRHTIERFGPVRSVRPEQVFEVGFEGIAPSKRHKSGIAVRFPRILRWRKDKPPGEADSLETALALLDVRREA